MSRGAGKIERAIVAAFQAEPDNAFTTEDLADRVFRGINQVEKKHRVMVLRAGKRLTLRERRFAYMKTEGLGGQLVFFDRYSVKSYAMARLKAEGVNQYRTADRRLRFVAVEDESTAFGYRFEPSVRGSHEKTQAQLAGLLEPGASYGDHVTEGGVWWHHVEIFKAEDDGDAEREARLKRDLGAVVVARHR